MIEKEVDRLGRIVIPMEYRKKLGITTGSKVVLSFNGNVICVCAAEGMCALCGKALENKSKLRLCRQCVSLVKEEL